MSDLFIRDAMIVDGTGRAAWRSDLRVSSGRIAELGESLEHRGEPLLEARGAILAPGFIDNHTHYDASLFWDPGSDPIVAHGVTTMLIGNCGLGLAPLRAQDRAELIDLFSFIEDIPADFFERLVPWEWETFGEYAQSLGTRRFGANVVVLVSHSLLRSWVMGAQAWERAATADEIAGMAAALEEAVSAGAIGLSTSLLDQDRQGRPVPSRLADDAEFDALFTVLGQRGAIAQLIASGSMNRAQRIADYRRLAVPSHKHGVRVLLNGFYDPVGDPEFAPALLAAVHEMNAEGARMAPMLSPRSFDLRVNFRETILFMHFPAWNRLIQASGAEKRRLLGDLAWRAQAKADWDADPNPAMMPTRAPDRLTIAGVGAKPQLQALVGTTLASFTEQRSGHLADCLADLLLDTDLDLELTLKVGNVHPDRIAAFAGDDAVLVGASDAGAHLRMFCAAGDTTLLLVRHVRERGDLAIEQAIHLLTQRQARALGLPDRGVIRRGAAADLVLFDLAELDWANEILVHDLPDGRPRLTRPSGGYRAVIVAGHPVVQNDGRLERLAGRFLGVAEETG